MLAICPISFSDANAFVKKYHRHHKPVIGHKFSIAVSEDGHICGVAIIGRPVARNLDDGFTLEVNRLCTDGTKNACSIMYGAPWRVAKSLGYKRMVTYILHTESGASLRASGWKLYGQTGGGSWSRIKRRRQDDHPLQKKLRWEVAI
ncbi:MAG: hypothetical protein KGL39_14015 [Patescibacteria group bacterium]|nr:hypothetical protein [Patescibacteria group bacterium]